MKKSEVFVLVSPGLAHMGQACFVVTPILHPGSQSVKDAPEEPNTSSTHTVSTYTSHLGLTATANGT